MTKYKKKASEHVFDVSNVLFLLLLTAITLYPFIHVIATSLSEPPRISSYNGFMFLPRGFTLEAYRRVLSNPEITRSFLNSILYVVTGTALSIVLTLIGGYVLSQKNLYWKGLITVFIVIPMYFSGGLIPSYLLIANTMNMRDTIWALIIPGCIGTYNLILMRTNFQQIPAEMEESAMMDGAPHLITLFRILVPLSKPIIAVLTLWHAVGLWNEWFAPAIYLTERSMYPIQLILREVMIQNSESPAMMMGVTDVTRPAFIETVKNAIAVVSIVPIICIYPFLQKYFVKGVFVGALKG